MRRWETLAALAAVIAASAGALRIPGRWWYTVLALVLLGVVALSRLASALGRSKTTRSDAAERAEQIRRQRHRR
jgi:membrane protein implicated in regulation of membrane protease activity